MTSESKRDDGDRDVAPAELERRRAAARRTALILAAVVLTIFIAFLVTGVTGRG
jgi:hypothetical protein